VTTVAVVRARTASGPAIPPGGHPKALLEAERGVKLVIPYAPRGAELGGLADTWERVDRPGRKPLTLRTGRRLPTLNLTLTLARPDVQSSIEDLLAALAKLGEAEERVTLSNMSPLLRGPWRIADLSLTSSALQYGTNHITRATATLSLVAASDALSRRGPLSGGKDGGKGGKLTRYTVKKGDTLRRIAAKPSVYGNPNKWTRLAQANGIKRPSAPLKPGRVLKVPR
jgi:nucleoid-associated protein YgaU